MAKLKELLVSRRFWGSLASTIAALQCYRLGIVGGPELASWLKTTLGTYVGAVGAENIASVLAVALAAKKST